jgi:cytochrome c nitrite reductase small subunit
MGKGRFSGIPWLQIAAGLSVGLALGVGISTFLFAKGHSYLTDRPEACANCHVMREYYDGWRKSSHHQTAVCNDCHTPAGFVGKYWTKTYNGFWHSYAFTTGDFPDVLRIKQRNRAVTQESCQKCHAELIAAMVGAHAGNARCVSCHQDVGHMH